MERKMVLIVDDNDSYRRTCAKYLERKGWKILEARDGLEGVEVAREAKPDLILMDVEMPGLDGIEALDKLKEDPDTREIPIIIMSSRSDPYEQETLTRNCPFFEKSPVLDGLLQKINQI
jgi:CheY-like chemotaxis protein